MSDDEEAEERASFEEAMEELRRIERDHQRQYELADFVCYLPTGQFIETLTGNMWPARMVNKKVLPVALEDGTKLSASDWLTRYGCVGVMVWAPGEDLVMQGRVVVDGGMIEAPGRACFNTYRPPTIVPGDKTKATPWLRHVITCFPDDCDHIIGFLAHAVQRPQEKVNHALVMISREQGVGKDTIIAPVRQAVGPWNCVEVSPKQLIGRFNGFAKSVILRISEAKALGETGRFSFYDQCKVFAASPPEVYRCDEKNKPETAVLNRCHMIITSNYVAGGLYLPPEDRRHYVAESPRRLNDFEPGYFEQLWHWFQHEGGFEHVTAYLHAYDLRLFNHVTEPPPKTKAFWALVGSTGSDESALMGDLLDTLDRPGAVTLQTIRQSATGDLALWFMNNPHSQRVRHFLEECDYRYFPNSGAKDTCWKIGEKRQHVYVRGDLPPGEQTAALAAIQVGSGVAE